MEEKGLLKGKYLMYKGKPLVRENNAICYGSMDDKYVLFMIILTNKQIGERTVPDRIIIQVISTDPNVSPQDKIWKQGERQGLFDAFSLGMIWLNHANEDDKQ